MSEVIDYSEPLEPLIIELQSSTRTEYKTLKVVKLRSRCTPGIVMQARSL